MHYASLREFIQRLEFENELVRVREPVSPVLEIAEIADRVSKQAGGGKALLFENVEGSSIPVLINAFGSKKRMAAALGVGDIEDIPRRMERFLKLAPPETLLDKARLLPLLLEASRFVPRRVPPGKAPCQEVVLSGNDVDLFRLPILQCWPQDAGRFITFPMVINRSYDRRVRNVGLYRMQVFDKKTTAMHWHIHKDGAHFFHEYRQRGKIMEVAVAIGGDPASCYAASAPLPYGVDEFLLAGFIRNAPVDLVPCKTVALEVPAEAEIVLEGFIDPAELRKEGPFGDHTGYYSQDGDYPVFHVTAITHRKNPIYLTTIVGKPPQEDYYLGHATERIFLPLLRLQLPELADMHMPAEGVFHNCVIVSIDKRFPMQARRVMSALWGAGQMSFVKTIIAVDAGVAVNNPSAILDLLLRRADFRRDLFFSEGILDVLNHASDDKLHGSKLGIDLTAKLPGEPGYGESLPEFPRPAPGLAETVRMKYRELRDCKIITRGSGRAVLLAALDKTRPQQGTDFIRSAFGSADLKNVGAIVVLEANADLNDGSQVMWKLFNNIDPRRDCLIDGNRIGIDVTRKLPEEGYRQEWPEEIEMSADIKRRVDGNWQKLFGGG